MRRVGLAGWYTRLGDDLARQADAGQQRVALPFAQLEVALLGHPLPRTARAKRYWWRNDGAVLQAWYCQ